MNRQLPRHNCILLALETSCDETAAAIVKDGRTVLASAIISQADRHKIFGGIVPEVAARQHVDLIDKVIDRALAESGVGVAQLAGIAATNGPGLIGTLLVGLSAAKALSWSWNLPLITVDHLAAHVSAGYIESDLEPPFIALLVSGGHTQIIHVENYGRGTILGETLDDASGEAFDKVARLLGLGYPGGQALDEVAKNGDAGAFTFPQARTGGFDFSFSGLKTAVLRCVEKLSPPLPVADLAAAFQASVVSVLLKKTLAAQNETGVQKIVLAGGVAANSALRAAFINSGRRVYLPKPQYCTDNAAMVAAAAYFRGEIADLSATAYSRKSR